MLSQKLQKIQKKILFDYEITREMHFAKRHYKEEINRCCAVLTKNIVINISSMDAKKFNEIPRLSRVPKSQ